ncbi:gamma-secretase subunit APH-1A [Meleagris gallopavo]|uniref:gamma-secretase subunit APH-1A n=1 Tax=Meleagris gallopavo TaxID=9103 RepID=UPI0012AB60BF|nr:gamma-secretase subunit APH-1A [Meleagris gallopavo]
MSPTTPRFASPPTAKGALFAPRSLPAYNSRRAPRSLHPLPFPSPPLPPPPRPLGAGPSSSVVPESPSARRSPSSLLTVAADRCGSIILVAGAFFWLVSLLLASLIWFISVHLSDQGNARLQYGLLVFGAAVSVLLQEAFRFAYFKLLKKADEGLATISEDGRSPISLKQMAYVSGLSFGIISGVFSVINILADSIGPGIVGIHGDSPYYFITSAFLTMAVVLLHTFWGVIFFDACEKRRYWCLGLVVISHLVTSGLTFLNPWYVASLVPIYIITFCMGIWAFFTAGGSLHNILKCLSCKQEDDSRVMMYSALQVPFED